MTRLDADMLIVGGGLAGACLATLLARTGVAAAERIMLVEPKLPPPGATVAWRARLDLDLRVSAISRASERILGACGVWGELPAERISAYERMCVWDAGGRADGAGSIRFDCAEIGQPNLGYILENRLMQLALLDRARELGVRMVSGQLAELLPQPRAMAALLHDGTRLDTALVIAADGADSPARRLMGIEVRGAPYGQHGLVTHLTTAGPHQRTAWQRFLPEGPIALLPLHGAGERRCSLVWSTSEARAREWAAAPAAEFCRAVTHATDGVVGEVLECSARAVFPLRRAHAERYAAARFVLVGDAAHTVHPLAGQGANLGFLDCAALAQVLGEARARGADPGELGALRRYERWRRGENLLMLSALDGLNRLFSNDNAPLSLLRRVGLTAVDRMGPLKALLMRQALGLVGELPAAAQ